MKLLVDMNLSPLWVPFLESRGFEVVHWSTVGQPSAPDKDILEYAQLHGFAVFTHDWTSARFSKPRRPTGPVSSMIRAQDVLPVAIGETAIRALQAADGHLRSGALVTVDPRQHRIRMLPI